MGPNLVTDNHISSNSVTEPISNTRFSLTPDNKITVDGITLLFNVPPYVKLTSFSSTPHSPDQDCLPPPSISKSVQSKSHNGAFLGFSIYEPSHRILNPIGTLIDRKFMSIFRFKTWWSTMWVGSNGSDLQMETQLVLLQVPESNMYVLLLPIIEGSFRSAIHPGKEGEVVLCVESGSTKVKASCFSSCLYFHVGENPFDLVKDALSAIRVHLGSFRVLKEKTPPRIVDRFGWCTWDAFYLTVEPVGVWHGFKSFVENGLPPRFLIIDDGWQSINHDHENPFEDSKDLTGLGSQMLCRLHRFEENDKFTKYRKGMMLGPDAPGFDQEAHDKMFKERVALAMAKKKVKEETGYDGSSLGEARFIEYSNEDKEEEKNDNRDWGLKALVEDMRGKFEGLEDVYVWHALCGAWGGVRPGTMERHHLKANVVDAKMAPGLERTMHDLAVVMVEKGGIGLVDPVQAVDLYEGMHSYLAKAGITGVKVDVIHTLEYVCEEYGGRVQLAKAYYNGLTQSLKKNFGGNGLIASMEQCNDFFFLATKQISMGRVGDDFWFEDPNGDPMGVYWLQGVHMVHCSYNSFWQGQFLQPDWDMFQSDHLCAEFHAGSRAICGGPVYVSDKVGHHNFDLLRKLVLPDGTILRCQHFTLPTRDCLFANPLFDGKTMLKILNLNKFGGVVGTFNCQGAGWDPEEHKCKAYPECYKPVTGPVSPNDVEWEQNDLTAEFRGAEQFAVYLNKSDDLHLVNSNDHIKTTLQPSSFEIFSFSPVQELKDGVKFAPVGLKNMFNCGGAIESLEYKWNGDAPSVMMKVKGLGQFLAYSSEKPREVNLNGEGVKFEWAHNGRLWFEVPWIGGELSQILIKF